MPDRDGRLDVPADTYSRDAIGQGRRSRYKLADLSHGFVGADLQALAKGTRDPARLRRILPEINLSADSIPGETISKIIVNMQDFMDVIKEMEPSAMREVFVEIPDVKWTMSEVWPI